MVLDIAIKNNSTTIAMLKEIIYGISIYKSFQSFLLTQPRSMRSIARSELIHDAQPYCDVTMEGGWGAANGWTSIRSLCPGGAGMPWWMLGMRVSYMKAFNHQPIVNH